MPRKGLYSRLRSLVYRVCRLLYRVQVEGREHIPRKGGCLLAANHDSSIDPAILALTTERPIRFIARAELWKPGLRRLLDTLGAIPIRRGAGDRSALRRAARHIRAGELVAIFPQGTVLRFRQRPYRSGAARIALETGAPIVPVRLIGTGRAFSLFPPRISFPRLRVVVGEPLPVEQGEPTIESAKELTAELERSITALE
jgi:1-acyl-sn-glycerol-3-phosphate acyltransferase